MYAFKADMLGEARTWNQRVPKHKIELMMVRYEKNVSLANLTCMLHGVGALSVFRAPIKKC